MTYQALKRLAKWLHQKAWWDSKENLDEMRHDFMTEIVSTSTLSTAEKVDLITDLLYGAERNEKGAEYEK